MMMLGKLETLLTLLNDCTWLGMCVLCSKSKRYSWEFGAYIFLFHLSGVTGDIRLFVAETLFFMA